MATSDQSSDGFGGFLGSRSNLVGLAALVAVFLAVFIVSQSPVAAALAALLAYGAAYLLAPEDESRTYSSGVPVNGATQEQMAERLSDLTRRIRTAHGRLPPSGERELAAIIGRLREMVERWDVVSTASEQRMVVESIAYDYLPSTLEVFLRLPDSAKPAHAQEWTEQLRVLDQEVSRCREAVLARDIEAMRTNGRLLEQKFEDGDLKMFREHGL